MPKRISYNVVYATSEDAQYPACELNSQTPACLGWRSFGRPPHELLLRLSTVTCIHQIQLLAHHQLVPSSVEVLVSGGLEIDGAQTPCGASYVSVGTILLAAPIYEAATRELKSAVLPEPTVARFVKLKVLAPHNPCKDDDQVALMAVNIIGDIIEDQGLISKCTKQMNISPYDDLSFIMYVDIEIAEMIRKLDIRKKFAVDDERFEYARRLKNCIESLSVCGLRIGRWRLRERSCALKANYEEAVEARDRVAHAVDAIKNDELLLQLFEDCGPIEENDSILTSDYDFSQYLRITCSASFAASFDVPSPRPVFENGNNGVACVVPTPLQEAPNKTQQSLNEADSIKEQMIDNKRICEIKLELAESTVDKHENEFSEDSLEFLDQNDFQIKDKRLKNDIKGCDNESNRLIDENEDVIDEKGAMLIEDICRRSSSRRSVTPNSGNNVNTNARKRNKSAGPRTTFEDYDETPIPTLKHSHTNEYLQDGLQPNDDCNGSVVSGGSSSVQLKQLQHKLNERERKHNALPLLIFGEGLVVKFYSKNYLEKEEGLNQLRLELTSKESSLQKTTPNKMARAASILLQRPLKDKVFTVFSLANEVVKVLFQEYVDEKVSAAEVGRCLDRLLPDLMKATGDPAPRVSNTAQHTILTLADCPCVKSLHTIPQMLVRPMAPSTHPRLALAKLQMLEQLIITHGISTDKQSGLTARRVAEVGALGVCAGSGGPTRACAERILLLAYARAPRLVRAQLPPDDAVTRRNLVYRHLFHQFDRMDMEKLLSQAPSETPNQSEKTLAESVTNSLEVGSTMSYSYMSGMSASYGGMTSSMSISTIAPSTASSATSRTKSSLKKTPTRRSSVRSYRDIPSYGFNKLKLDSAESPKHSPKNPGEKVHFQDSPSTEVILRRSSQRNSDNSNSRIPLKQRPNSCYESVSGFQIDLKKSSYISQESSMKNCKSLENIDRRKGSGEYPRMGMSLHLEDGQMDESGYYSPGEKSLKPISRSKSGNIGYYTDGYEAGDASSGGNTPEPHYSTSCEWCGRSVRSAALESHRVKRCLVLATCPLCRTTTHARHLHKHLLEDCVMSEAWIRCEGCGAALKGDEGSYHARCTAAREDEWKCPYCLLNVQARDEPWIRHLSRCPRNPRTSNTR